MNRVKGINPLKGINPVKGMNSESAQTMTWGSWGDVAICRDCADLRPRCASLVPCPMIGA
jgi:hypothetical protein